MHKFYSLWLVVYVNRLILFRFGETFLKMPFLLLTRFHSSELINSNFIRFTTFTPTLECEKSFRLNSFTFQSTFMLLSFTLTINTKCEKINFSSRLLIFFRGMVEEKCWTDFFFLCDHFCCTPRDRYENKYNLSTVWPLRLLLSHEISRRRSWNT